MDSVIQKNIRIIIAIVLIGGAFWVGYEFGATSSVKMAAGIARQPTVTNAPQGQTVASAIGTVVSVAGSTITVKDVLGKQQTVSVDSSTVITTTKVATESLSDIHAGDSVLASGTENSTGTLVAQRIQTGPASRAASGTSSTSTAAQ